MSDDLNCPFCGSQNLKSGGDDKFVGVWCLDCQATGPNHYGRFDWNTRADTAAAQVAAALEKAAKRNELTVRSIKEALDMRDWDAAREIAMKGPPAIRALATDTQTDALEQVRRDAERAGYERGVREAARHAASATGDIDLMSSILALIDYPTPAPDTQADALEQVRKEAALKALADMGQEWDADIAAAQVAAAYERAADLCVDQFQAHLDLVITGNPDNARNRESAASMAEKLSHEIRALATDTQTDALEQVRRDAERAGYERGVREAARHAASATGDIDLMNSILALLDDPTPDPDEPTKAQELAFRKAVSS